MNIKKRILRFVLPFLASFLMVFGSLAPAGVALAQEVSSPTPQPEAGQPLAEDASPTPEIQPSPTEEASPTSEPSVEPSAFPEPLASPDQNTSDSNGSGTNINNNNPAVTASPSPEVKGQSSVLDGHIDVSLVKGESQTDPILESLTLSAPQESASSASVVTDKSDYSPTEAAVISGSNFSASTTYTLVITSSDLPAVNFSTDVTTSDQGTFTYTYQLDGNYRPLYKVEVKDKEGVVLATTTFTDTRTINSVTLNGGSGVTVAPGASITAAVNATTSGSGSDNDWDSTSWRIATTPPGSTTCEDTSDQGSSGTFTKTFTITAPTSTGIYNAYFKIHDGNSCGATNESALFTMNNAVTVVTPDLIVTKTNDVGGSVTLGNTFVWTLTVQNTGSASATFNNQDILEDDLPSSNVSYSPTSNIPVTTSGGVTGTIDCDISSNTLDCDDNSGGSSVVIPVGGSFSVSITVTPTDTGTLTNPKSGGSNKCMVDPDTDVTESNENNNTCSDSVAVSAASTPAPNLNWPTSWSTPNSCVSDPANDENPSSTDIIGDGSNPAVGFASDANYQYFRERLNGNPAGSGGFDQFAWVTLFQTSTPQYQYLGSLNGLDEKVQLYANTVNSPDSSGVDFSPLFNDPADSIAVWEGSAGSYATIVNAGGGVYYAQWAIPLSELTSRGITVNTTKFFATSANANNYNKDHLNCYEAIADLSVVKSDSPDPVNSGGTLTYTLTVHNNGPDTAAGVIVTDTLPAGYSVTSVTPSQGSCSDTSAPSIQCELGSLANGATATITIVGTITGSGIVTNSAAVSSSTLDTNTSNNQDSEDTTINDQATITVVKNVLDPDDNEIADTHQFAVNVGAQSDQIGEGDNGVFTVTAGTYAVTEDSDSDYDLVSITPDEDSGQAGVQVNVAAGDQQTVNVVNKQKKATITVVKDVRAPNGDDVSDNHTFAAQLNGADNKNFSEQSSTSYEVNPGRPYTIGEVADQNYDPQGCKLPTGENATEFTLTSNQSITVTCTNNQKNATITIIKDVRDFNGNEATDSAEFTVRRDGSDAKQFAEGSNAIYTVAPGTYTFTEDSKTGYTLHSISPDNDTDASNGTLIIVGSNESGSITFVNWQNPASISGTKFDEDGETGLLGWTIELYTCELGFLNCLFSSSDETDSNGFYSFDNLVPGLYQVTEVLKSGWTNLTSLFHNLTIGPGDNTEDQDFTNERDTGTIIIHKILDEDGDLQTTNDQTPGESWVMDVDGTGPDTDDPSLPVTDSSGETSSGQIKTGEYTAVEGVQTGYHIISAECTIGEETTTGTFDGTDSIDGIQVGKDQTVNCTFINRFIQPVLQISKTNNKTGIDLAPGSDVTYTITLEVLDNDINDVTVTDLLPGGFTYRLGSATINGVPAVPEPVYASPGTWNLGSLANGDEVVLTLIADIGGSQQPGLYKDVAWAQGRATDSSTVLALAVNPGDLDSGDSNFVGTDVNVVKDTQNGASVNVVTEGQVLGAKTELPATGARTLWLILAGFGAVLGVALVSVGFKLRRKHV